jgi:D-lactate dehydrogenase
VFSGLLKGFGINLLGYDLYQSPEFIELGGKHVDLETLFAESDIISLRCPLTRQTFHLIDAESITKMKKGS